MWFLFVVILLSKFRCEENVMENREKKNKRKKMENVQKSIYEKKPKRQVSFSQVLRLIFTIFF